MQPYWNDGTQKNIAWIAGVLEVRLSICLGGCTLEMQSKEA